MKNWSLLVGAVLLAGCGTYQFQPTVDVGTDADDSKATVTVTKAVTAATATSPAKTTWTAGTAGATTFVFRSRPGSQAVNITGYKIVSDNFNGKQIAAATPVATLKTNIYVPSGFSCTAVTGNTQSCAMTDPTTVPAEGQPSVSYGLDLTSALADEVVQTNASAYRTTEIVFVGRSATGATVEIPTRPLYASGIKRGDE